MKRLLILFIPLFISCKNQVVKTSDSLLIHLSDSVLKTVRLQVINKDIIHICATADNTLQEYNSMIVDNPAMPFTKWNYKKTDSLVILSTESLIAEVSTKNGTVVFKDTDGNVILKEKNGGGKTFAALEAGNKKLFSVRQVFESPDDEAFYGLGQHQNRQMNYKGEDVELAQHNLVAIVPFLYSSKNYGILWDNYSITRFGDSREFQPISGLNLFSKDGEPGGLTASYFHQNKLVLSRMEDTIDYQYLESMDRWPGDVPKRDVKIVWEGSFSSETEGNHKFSLYASEYFKLWIDDKLIFDRWRQNWNPWYHKFQVEMAKNEKHTIKIEWIPNEGYLALLHLDPLPVGEQNNLSLYSEVAHAIDYYFIKGNSADEVISGYRKLTGKAPIMPKWAMGFWQSRERYKTQEELTGVVKEFRNRGIPLDNIVLDWFYWREDDWGSHEFDKERFPDPDGMIKELHDSFNTRIMISVWPKFYRGTGHFDQMNEKGFLYQRNLQLERKDWVGPGYISTFYDAFNPEARKLFWHQINEKLNSKGIDAWWLDATEPDMQSNHSIAERKLMMDTTFLGSGAQFFNAFSYFNSKAVYEGSRAIDPDKRVFILTRSAFAGQQRYAAVTWSGDVASRWSDLGDQVAAGINFSISGIPYWTHDIGGFSLEKRFENPQGKDLDEWRELNTRWYQFGAFCPIFRVHGQFPYREVYNIAPESHPAYRSMLYYNKLRYRLMPYIYTLTGMAYHQDYTIMRALVMDFPGDRNVHNISDQYMFGPSLMVCPVHEYKARQREVYLPAGTGWYDLNTGKYYNGGQNIITEAPLEKIPLFVKQGSVIPFGPEMQYTGEKNADSLVLYVYGGRDAEFTLYEDDGVTYNYEKGDFSFITIKYNDENRILTIENRQGEYPGMLKDRVFKVVFIDPEKETGIDVIPSTAGTVNYNGTLQSLEIK
ncbi:MAG: DUF5110 domain-containing protein [Bacteroidales bacterium]|nr:DUF5110 domain-containing protein [Bacteroidales bacterium]